MRSTFKYPLLGMLLLLLLSSVAVAQDNDLVRLSGSITDDGKRLIAHASVQISGSTIGTITNEEGHFNILVPANLHDHYLTISYIGYQTAKVAINRHLHGEAVFVALGKSIAQLKEVVISAETAAGIVAHAYRNINKNYPQTNTFYTGFYRESNLHEGAYGIENYNYVIEAVIKMNKPSYFKTNPEGDIEIEQSRRKNFSYTDSISHWYAGAYTPIRFDVAKKRFDFIDPAHLKRYIYTKKESTTYYDEPVYVISFAPRKSAQYSGTLYIDMQTYAIVKVDYQLTELGLKDFSLVASVKLKYREFKTNYQPIGDKWYLQSVWQQAIGTSKITGPFRYTTEYAATQIDTNRHDEFNYGDKLQFNEVLSAKALSFNKGFWDNYNIVSETQQLRELLIDTTAKVNDQSAITKANTLKGLPIADEKVHTRKSFSEKLHYRPILTFPFLNMIHTNANSMAISYNQAGHTLINQNVAIKPSDLTVGYSIGYDFNFFKDASFEYNINYSAGHVQTIANDLGLIYRIRLTPPTARPFKLLIGLAYAFVSISKNLDDIPAGNSAITIGNKTFTKGISPELMSKQDMFNPQLGFSLEINRLLIFYVKGGYFLPGSQNDDIRFTAKSQGFFKSLFPAHTDLPLNSTGVNLTVDGQAANKLPYRDDFNISMGLVGTIRFSR